MYMSSGPVFGQAAILSAGLSCAASACKLLGAQRKARHLALHRLALSVWHVMVAALHQSVLQVPSNLSVEVYFCLGILSIAYVRPTTRKTGQGRSVSLSPEEGA